MNKLFLYLVKGNAQETPLAGLTPTEWLLKETEGIPRTVVAPQERIDPPEEYEYLAILTPATFLVTAADLKDLVKEMDKRCIVGMEIGAGRVQRRDSYLRGENPKCRCTSTFAKEVKTGACALEAERMLYRRIAEISAQNGAIIPDVGATYIDARSVVESGAIIEPFTVVKSSVVKSGARIGSFSQLENARVESGATVMHSVIRDSVVGENCTVGPFAYLRMGSRIGENCRVGDFVEVKNSRLGAGTKAAHLAYIGDASVGEKTNVGCGTVFANYDGKRKHETVVGSGVFIGANTNLIAPVTVGDGAYIAAASTVTKDVPQGTFVIGRVREEHKRKRE